MIPKELLHPELREQSALWLSMRSDFPLRYMYPQSAQVLWYGDLMVYSTLPLYQDLAMKFGARDLDFLDDGRLNPTIWQGEKLDRLREDIRKWLTQFD